MLSKLFTILFLASILLSFTFNGYANPLINDAIQEATEKKLGEDFLWKKLLWYKTDRLKFFQVKSAIINKDFFLDKQGQQDSDTELKASINKVFLDQSKPPIDKNQDFRCLYPARFLFFKNNLASLSNVPFIKCPDYDRQLRYMDKKVSLIFASGYLKNPSSFYGHIFLKFSSNEKQDFGNLLDSSFNFGAIYPPDENPVIYIAKGIGGGYIGKFSNLDFYHHQFAYNEKDLRDLYDYELNLSHDNIKLLNAHAWEMLRAEFDYYFLKQNCAYHMAEIIQAVSGISLLNPYKDWVVPVDIFRELKNKEIAQHKLIKKITYIPSTQSKFYHSFSQLNQKEKADFQNYLIQENFSLSNQPSAKVLDSLIDYYSFSNAHDKENLVNNNDKYYSLLRERFKFQKRDKNFLDKEKIVYKNPHEGGATSRLAFGAVYNDDKSSNSFVFRFRSAYYDYLSQTAGSLPFSELVMSEGEAYINHQRFELTKLDIVKVSHLNLSKTGLENDGGLAWSFALGLDRENLSCKKCTEFYTKGGIGKATKLFDDVAIYAMLNTRVFENPIKKDNFYFEPTIGSILFPEDPFRLSFNLSNVMSYNRKDIIRYELETATSLNENQDIRLSISHDDSLELKSFISFYF